MRHNGVDIEGECRDCKQNPGDPGCIGREKDFIGSCFVPQGDLDIAAEIVKIHGELSIKTLLAEVKELRANRQQTKECPYCQRIMPIEDGKMCVHYTRKSMVDAAIVRCQGSGQPL